jgi:hypothetical protein
MNKIILFSIVAIALMSGMAIADTGIAPCPLAFTFLTSPSGAAIGQEVTLTYQDKIFTGTVNEYGELVMDLGAEGIPNCNAQNFKLTVMGCKDDPVCTQTVSFNPNGYTTIDLRDANQFEKCPEDTTPYASCNSCCLTPSSCEDQGYIKPADCPVQEQPDYTIDYFVSAIVIFIAGLGIGKYKLGVKIYTNTKGEVITQHTHRNITGYHSVNTMHQHQPHKKGEIAPKYADTKGADGYYAYMG